MSGNVEVLRDAYGVPQIYADTAEDLFAAQGFVHAQDRFYEMDFRRHLASGRLSELYGESQVETDAYIRTLGWRRVAEAELALLAPSSRRYLDAYASGVNAYLTDRSAGDLSLEYSLLGLQGLDYEPQPWTAVGLAGLAQGDGVGPGLEPPAGDRAGDPDQRARRGPGHGAVPVLSSRGPRAHRQPGRGRERRLRSRRSPRVRPARCPD